MEIGKAVTSTFNMDQILATILERLQELIPANNWSLLLLEPETRTLRFEVAVGLDTGVLADVRIPLGEGIAGTVAATGEPLLVEEVSADSRFSRRVDELTGFVTRSLICLPLKIRDSVMGVVEIINPQDRALFHPRSMIVLSILADYLAIAIGNALNYRKIAALSLTDTVTGFYNTRFLHQHLDALLRPTDGRTPQVSLVFLDMDGFKKIVDTHGHLLGSKVLKEVAEVIAAALEPQDRLVHYGGDEFVILMPGQDKAAALDRVRRVRRALTGASFLKEEGKHVRLTASFGIANYPEDAGDKAALLRLADDSMFRSKESGKDTITLAEESVGRPLSA
jgi:diguanylate cyclase (GGDEF)-like protein